MRGVIRAAPADAAAPRRQQEGRGSAGRKSDAPPLSAMPMGAQLRCNMCKRFHSPDDFSLDFRFEV